MTNKEETTVNSKTEEFTVEIIRKEPKDIKVRDYQYLFPKGCSPKYREKYWIWDIWINWAVCLNCKEFIRSKNVYNFVTCSCWNISVDWGSFYAKRVFKDNNSFVDVIEYFDNIIN